MGRDFDGTDDYISCGTVNPLDGATSASIVFWVIYDSLFDGGKAITGFSGGSFQINQVFNVTSWTTQTDKIRFDFCTCSANASNAWRTNTALVAGQWKHVAAIWTGGNGRATYFNGESIAVSALLSGNPSALDMDAAETGYMNIGSEADATTNAFDGKIAHVHLYNRALSAGEVKLLMRYPGSINNGLVGYWPLNGVSSKELDYSKNRNHGTVTGALPKHETPFPTAFLFPPRFNIPFKIVHKRSHRKITAASAAITGTATASITEADIVTGGKTIIITLTNDTWIAAGAASFDLQRDEIIAGLTSAQSELFGWNNVVKVLQGVAGVVRTSDSVVTITLDAQATYNITATETITVTVPGTALNGGNAIVAAPTFTVSAVVSGAYISRFSLLGVG